MLRWGAAADFGYARGTILVEVPMALLANDKAGKFILRVALGAILLFHGIAKLRSGVDWMAGPLGAHGLPAALAYGAYVGEVLAPLMLIAGFYARVGAALVCVHMLFALFLVHQGELFSLNDMGSWAIEFQALLLFSALTVLLIGPGKAGINEK